MASKADDTNIATVFSSDSSDDERNKPVCIKVDMSDSGSEPSHTKSSKGGAPQEKSKSYLSIEKNRIGKLKHNTLVQYETTAGKLVKSKYFKKCDVIGGTVTFGFYPHNKKNYTQPLSGIKSISISRSVSGGMDDLQGTLEIPNEEWKTIRRDMVISYEKEDHEFVYRAKFNSFIKASDGSTRMSLTSERGFNYIANPIKILKIYRHVTSNDKTLTFILEALRKLETRVRILESNQKKSK